MKKHIFSNYLIIIVILLKTSTANAEDFNFIKNQISFGYYNHNFWQVNIRRPSSPIFWKASTKMDSGFMVSYERNIFHTHKYFSINFGTSFSQWQFHHLSQTVVSAFVDFRFWIYHFGSVNPYILYSIGGPSYISRRVLDKANLGAHFIFQDLLGIGIQFGKNQAIDMSLLLYHCSNGDFFTHNSGFDVPLVYSVGMSF